MMKKIIFICLIITSSATFGSCEGEKKPQWYKPDLGPEIHIMGRPAMWQAKDKILKNSKFKASAGPSFYKDEANIDPDYYRIEVVYPLHDGNTLVCFSREFNMKDVPKSLLNKPIEEIISYSEKKRTVTFTIGKNKYSYILPLPEEEASNVKKKGSGRDL